MKGSMEDAEASATGDSKRSAGEEEGEEKAADEEAEAEAEASVKPKFSLQESVESESSVDEGKTKSSLRRQEEIASEAQPSESIDQHVMR